MPQEEIYTKEILKKMITEEPYKNHPYLTYLVEQGIIQGISEENFDKIWEFIQYPEITSVYDYDFLNLICKNMVLLYCNIDEYELDEQEQIAKLNKYHQAMDIFYQLISSGELKTFDRFVNIIMGRNQDPREKIKTMLEILPNYEKYQTLAQEIVEKETLEEKERYTLLELLKKKTSEEEIEYDYEEYEKEFYPDDREINSIEDLREYRRNHHEVLISKVRELQPDEFGEDTAYMLKNEIVKLLTNMKFYGENSFDTIGFEQETLKELRSSLKDEKLKEELSKYILFVKLIEEILRVRNFETLKKVAIRIANYKENNNNMNIIYHYTEQMAKRIKEMYAHEIQEKLCDFHRLEEGEHQGYSREKEKYTAENKMLYDENISGRKVDYIELSGIDYVSFVHVLNAYGEGGTLKDFKNPRIVGKEYICVSGIDEEKTKIAYTEAKDEEHVRILFSQFERDQFITESSEDLYSDGEVNSLSISLGERENFRPIKKQIQNNQDSHTEFILYRESANGKPLYPSGILLASEIPTQAEINAAAYLNVPLVYINKERYKQMSHQTEIKNEEKYQPTSEEYKVLRETLIELRNTFKEQGRGR